MEKLTTVTRVPKALLTKFKERDMKPSVAFAMILDKWDMLFGLMPTPTVQSSQSSFRASDIRKQVDLALEDEREKFSLQVLQTFVKNSFIVGEVNTKAGDRKIMLNLRVPNDKAEKIRELLE